MVSKCSAPVRNHSERPAANPDRAQECAWRGPYRTGAPILDELFYRRRRASTTPIAPASKLRRQQEGFGDRAPHCGRPPGGCRMRWRPQSSSASAPCRRVGAAPKVRTPFRAFWRVGGTPVGDLSRPSASRLALRSASPDAASYTTFDPSFDTTFAVMPRAGLSNGLSPGSKSAAACGRTASENSIPACSSST